MCVSAAQCECECMCIVYVCVYGMCVCAMCVCVSLSCVSVPADLYLLPSCNTLINFVIFLGSFASGIVCHQKTRLKLPCLHCLLFYTPLSLSLSLHITSGNRPNRGTSLRDPPTPREKSHEAVATFLRLPKPQVKVACSSSFLLPAHLQYVCIIFFLLLLLWSKSTVSLQTSSPTW